MVAVGVGFIIGSVRRRAEWPDGNVSRMRNRDDSVVKPDLHNQLPRLVTSRLRLMYEQLCCESALAEYV